MIPLPISDENRASRVPFVTMGLIVVNVLVWFFELAHGVELATLDYGLIPHLLTHQTRDGILYLPEFGRAVLHQEVPWPWTVLTSMFMHGGWLHIIGNMWFLWIFGDNVEDALGPVRYLIFYLLCGLAAAGAQVAVSPNSMVPMVGASGAIAGVLGAYLLLYPHARVRCLLFIFILVTFIYVPAWLLLGLWFLSQILFPEAGVAWMAHVGGFVAGFALIIAFLGRRRPPPRRQHFPPLWERV